MKTLPTFLAAAALAALLPATASAAGNPAVARVNPTTGAVKVLAGGAPFSRLGGLALGANGTLYAANQGPDAGIYAVNGSSVTPVATAAPTLAPASVVASGMTLYSLDGDRVLAVDTTTGVQRVVTSGGLYDQLGVQPLYGALSGTTLYTTASSSCDSAEGGGSYVIAVDTTTGVQTLVKSLGCAPVGGVVVTPSGLLVAVGGKPAKIVRIIPGTGVMATKTAGGQLKAPQGLALDASGNVIVADAKRGVIAVAAQGGGQSPYTDPGAVTGAAGVAVGSDGSIYVSEAGPAPTLRASAAKRQAVAGNGVAFAVRCNRACTVAYTATVRIGGRPSFAKSAAVRNVSGLRRAKVTLPAQVKQRIAGALRAGTPVSVQLRLTPQDPRSGSAGAATTLSVKAI